MKFSALLTMLIVAAMASASCSEEIPTAPGASRTPAIQVRCPEFGESSRCNAFAVFSQTEGMDVTGLAEWSTSDAAIASVTSTGLVTPRATGEVAIRASYQGGIGFVTVWAVAGNGLHGISRILAGSVLSLNGALPDVLMEILNGPNAGRRVTTSSNGGFYIDGLADGQFTIRLSKPGYQTAEYVWWIPGGDYRTPTLSVAK